MTTGKNMTRTLMRQLLRPMRNAHRVAAFSITLSSVPFRLSLAALVATAAGCLGAGFVVAHVDVDVGDGQYVMEVGFRDEPAYVGQPNAIYIHVEEYATGGTEPVDGLASTLTAEVSKDGQSLTPSLMPMGDGTYEAIFVPTETGDYTFRISGTIGEATVDESVTSSPNTFDSVQPLTAIEFPPQEGASPGALAQSAQTEAANARMFGIAGTALGALGLVLAVVAWLRAGQAHVAAPKSARPIEPAGKLIK
jgi:hypothetical protein